MSLTLPVISENSTTFNLSDPAPGDWYVAAHLPEDDGRIEQKVGIEQRMVNVAAADATVRLATIFLP